MHAAGAKIIRGGALVLALIYLFSALNVVVTASWHRLHHWFSDPAYHPHQHFAGEQPQSHHHHHSLLDIALRLIAGQKPSPGADSKPALKLIKLKEHLIFQKRQAALHPDRRPFPENRFSPPESAIADLCTPPPEAYPSGILVGPAL